VGFYKKNGRGNKKKQVKVKKMRKESEQGKITKGIDACLKKGPKRRANEKSGKKKYEGEKNRGRKCAKRKKASEKKWGCSTGKKRRGLSQKVRKTKNVAGKAKKSKTGLFSGADLAATNLDTKNQEVALVIKQAWAGKSQKKAGFSP